MTGLGDEVRLAPQELVGEMPPENRARLADYLDTGMEHAKAWGYSWCRIGCQIDSALMGSKDLSDGTWVWPEGLSHYVREHHTLLPEEFIQDALSKTTPVIAGWTEVNGIVSQNKDRADEGYWLQWCSSRRAPQFLEQLRNRRITVEALAAADSISDTNEKVAALVRERGLSDANCVWRGCPHKALVGGYNCGDHFVQKDADPRRRLPTEFGRLLSELNEANDLRPARPATHSTGRIARGIAQLTRCLWPSR